MPHIDFEVSNSVWAALEKRRDQTGESLDSVVESLLSDALTLERHSLFQVSTSNALVEGVFGGVITVSDLKRHGDLGLGTFSGLDGEMIMVDGDCFRATSAGSVAQVDDDREVPFALVTRFSSDSEELIEDEVTLAGLFAMIDEWKPSENLFLGVRVDGHFDELAMRAACRAEPGESLVEATGHQSEFDAAGVEGTLVGFWSPEYSRAISVPGYHFHFISDDRTLGGHVLGLRTNRARVRLHTESDLHLALPETAEFLTADLSGDHQGELEVAESQRDRGSQRQTR